MRISDWSSDLCSSDLAGACTPASTSVERSAPTPAPRCSCAGTAPCASITDRSGPPIHAPAGESAHPERSGGGGAPAGGAHRRGLVPGPELPACRVDLVAPVAPDGGVHAQLLEAVAEFPHPCRRRAPHGVDRKS